MTNQQHRQIGIGLDQKDNKQYKFPNNFVRTARYTWWNFPFKNLAEQFRRAANLYFLLISVLQVSTDLSPTNRFSTLLPLIGVLFVSMVKSGIEDYRRHKADSVTNNAKAKILRIDGSVDTVRWRDIQVGDVVVMHDRESCPADLVLLASSDERGSCFIQTRSIDGETNLKQRNAVLQTQLVAGPILHQYTSVLGLSMSANSIRSRATTVPAPRPQATPAADADAAAEEDAPDGTQLDDAHCNVDVPKYNALLKKVGAELPVFSGSMKVDPPNNQLYRLSGVADINAIPRRQWIKKQMESLDVSDSPGVLEHSVGTQQPLPLPPGSPVAAPKLRQEEGLRSPGLESKLTAPRSIASQYAMSDVASAGVGSSAAPGLRMLETEGGVEFEFNSSVQSIDHDSMVLRGTIIRNTKMVLGVAVYTGPDSKIIMNSNESPSKTSRIDAIVNGSMLLILLALVVMCTASTMLSALFKQRERLRHASYLTFLLEAEHSGRDALGLLQEWITALILFNNLVPISLYVTLELVRWFQARNMEGDKHMYDAESKTAMVARTSDINEDLGQVEYVFTDKTGTLTQNSMMFKMCSVGGYVYGASRLKVSISRRTITRNNIDTPTAAASVMGGFGTSKRTTSELNSVPRVRTKLKISGMNLASSAYVRDSSEGGDSGGGGGLHLASNGSEGSLPHNAGRRSSAPIVAVPMAAEGTSLPPRPKPGKRNSHARATVLSDPGHSASDQHRTAQSSDDEMPSHPPHQLGFTSGGEEKHESMVLSGGDDDDDAGAFYSEDEGNTRNKHGSSFTRGNVPVVSVQLLQEEEVEGQLGGGRSSPQRDDTANASTVHTFDEEMLPDADDHSSQSVDSPGGRNEAVAPLRTVASSSLPSSSGRDSSDMGKRERPDSKGVISVPASRNAIMSTFAVGSEKSANSRSDSSGVAPSRANLGNSSIPRSSEGTTRPDEVKEMLVKACLHKYIPGGFRFFDPRLVSHLEEGDVQSELLAEYLLCCAACHTVVAERPNSMQLGSDDGELEYQAASPDEAALVAAARGFGFEFVDRRGDEITISVHGKHLKYKVLATNQFSSARRMMSVLLRTPEGRTVLYAKGADQAIMERLWINNPHAVHAYHQHSQAAAMDHAAAVAATEYSMGSGSPNEGPGAAVGVDAEHWGLSDAETPKNARNVTIESTSVAPGPDRNVLRSMRNLLSTEQIATSDSGKNSAPAFEGVSTARNLSLSAGTPMNANKGHGGLTTSLARNIGSFSGPIGGGAGGNQIPLALSLRNGFQNSEEESKRIQEAQHSPVRSPSGGYPESAARGPLGIAAHPRRSSVDDRLAGELPARSFSGNRNDMEPSNSMAAPVAGIPPRQRPIPSHMSRSVGYIAQQSDPGPDAALRSLGQGQGEATVVPVEKVYSEQSTGGNRPQTSHSAAVSSVVDELGLSPDAESSDVDQTSRRPVDELLSDAFGYDGVLDWELQHVSIVEQHLHEFGLDGFRVMVMAKREISPETAEAWLQLHKDANEALVDREAKLLAAANSIENNLSMLGASAIEDKLQKGVPRTIANLARGGIRMWMLTGDKEETAVNIGVSCRLLTEDMQVLMINGTTRDQCIAQLAASRSELRFKGLWDPTTVNENLALVLEGRALQLLLPPNEGFSGFKDNARNKSGGLIREVLEGMVASAKEACCSCCISTRRGNSHGSRGHGNPPASGRRRRRSNTGHNGTANSSRSVMSSGMYTARSNRALVARALAQSSHNLTGGDFDDDEDREANDVDNELAQFSACELAVAWVLLTISDLFGTCFSCCRKSRRPHHPHSPMPPSPGQGGAAGSFNFSDDDMDDTADDQSVSTASTRSFGQHASMSFRSTRSAGSRSGGGGGGGTGANSFTSSRSLIDNKKNRGTSHGTTGMTSRRTFERELLEIARQCKAVVGCRLSPLQKAQVVRLVKYGVSPSPLTLAIGDGGNDVSMIQEAHVGVGISGVEGMQAVRASDFALAQFRFLERLLLVHGRFNYQRVAFTISYSFYKNVALVLTLFLFTFFNAFSGATLYESFLGSAWNVLFTVLPVIIVGIFDRDVRPRDALRYPALYLHGQQNRVFSGSTLARWMTTAAWHAFATFFGMYALWLTPFTPLEDGTPASLWMSGAGVNFALVIVVNLRVLVSAQYWSIGTLASVAFSLIIWVIFVLLYSSLVPLGIRLLDIFPFIGVGPKLLSSQAFWMALIPVVSLITILDAAHAYYSRYHKPQLFHIVQEWAHGWGHRFSPDRMAKIVRRFLMWEKDPASVKKDLYKSARRRKKKLGIPVEDSDSDEADDDAKWAHGTSKLTTMKTVQENRNTSMPLSNSRRSIISDDMAHDSGEDEQAAAALQHLAEQKGILDGKGRIASQAAIPASAGLPNQPKQNGKASASGPARGAMFSASRRGLPSRTGLTTSLMDRQIPFSAYAPAIDTRINTGTSKILGGETSSTPENGAEGSLTPQAFQPARTSAAPITLARNRSSTHDINRLPVTAEHAQEPVQASNLVKAGDLRVDTGSGAGYSATAPAVVAPLAPPAAPLPEVEPVPEEEHEGHIAQVTKLRSSLWKNMEQQWIGEYREKLRRDKISELQENERNRKRRRSSMADFGKSVRRIFTRSNVFQPEEDRTVQHSSSTAGSSIFSKARTMLRKDSRATTKSPPHSQPAQSGAPFASVAGLDTSPGLDDSPDAFPYDSRHRAQSSPQRNPGGAASPAVPVRQRAASERPPGNAGGLDTLSDNTAGSSKNRKSSDGANSGGLDRLVDEIVQDDGTSLVSGGTTQMSERTKLTGPSGPSVGKHPASRLLADSPVADDAPRALRSQSDASQSNRGPPLSPNRAGTNIDTREADGSSTPRSSNELLRSNSPSSSGQLLPEGTGSFVSHEARPHINTSPNRNGRTASRISAASSALVGEGIVTEEHVMDATTIMTVSGRTGFTSTAPNTQETVSPAAPKISSLPGPGIALNGAAASQVTHVAEAKTRSPFSLSLGGSKSKIATGNRGGVNASFFRSGSATGSARNSTMSPTSKARAKAASFWEDSFAIYYMTNTMHGVGGVSSSSRPTISKVLQRFTGNKQLERRYQRQHLAPTGVKLLQYLLYMMYVLLAAGLVGEIIAGYQDENGETATLGADGDSILRYLRVTVMRSVFFAFGLICQAMIVFKRQFVLRHYEMFMLGVSLVAGVLILFFKFAEVFMRAMVFLIALFLIMRLHFTHAVFTGMVVFLVTLILASSSTVDLAVNTTSFALTAAGFMCFLAYAAYSTGLNMRRDFAQQRQLRVEQRRANRILSNTMPPHITNRILTGLVQGWDAVTPVNAATSAALSSVKPERSISFGREASARSTLDTPAEQVRPKSEHIPSSKAGRAKGAPPPPPRIRPPQGTKAIDLTAGASTKTSTVVTLNTIIDDSIAPSTAASVAVGPAPKASSSMPASLPKELGALSARSRRKSRRTLGSFTSKPAPTQLFIDEEPNVTVLFVDLLDFPVLVQRHTPSQLVSILDSLYSLFDVLASRHRVYKVESVGKTWMAAAGLSSSRPDHAAACINLGMDIVDHVVQIRNIHGEQSFHMKVGVNSGPLVTGVVGLKKPQFCLFGDTVNTASRMQSTGVMDRVHISPNTEAEVSGLYNLEPREVQVKGKGIMNTFLVRGARGEPLPKHIELLEKKLQRSVQMDGGGAQYQPSLPGTVDASPVAGGGDREIGPTTPPHLAPGMNRSASLDSGNAAAEATPVMLGVASSNRRRTVSAAVEDEDDANSQGAASDGAARESGAVAQRGHSMPFSANGSTGNIRRVGSFGKPPMAATPQHGSPLARAAKPMMSPPDSPLRGGESGRSNAQSTPRMGPFPPAHANSKHTPPAAASIDYGTAQRARDVTPKHNRNRSRSDAAGLRRSQYGLAAQARIANMNNSGGSSFGSKRAPDEVHLSDSMENEITSQAQHFLRTRMKKWKKEEEAQLSKSIEALSTAVEMNNITHTFLDPVLESQYWLLTMSKRVRRIRVVLGCLSVLFFYRAIEVLLTTDDDFSMRFVGSKLIFSAFTAGFLFLTSGMRRRAQRHNVPIWFWLISYIVLLGAAAVLVTSEESLGIATIDLMMFMVFCSNGRILSVLRSTLLNCLVVAALTVTATVESDWGIRRERDGAVNWQLMFYWYATLIVTTMAASTTEYHMRRGFGLDILTVEQTRRAERLLYQMLPRAAVSQLKEGRTGVSDSYRGVTLLFMDLCGFTRMSASLKPTQVVTMLNQLFSHFDKLTDKYRVMKVQTIGDAYIAVAGLPFDDTMSGTWVTPAGVEDVDGENAASDADTASASEASHSQSRYGPSRHPSDAAGDDRFSATPTDMGIMANASLVSTQTHGTGAMTTSNMPSTGTTHNYSHTSAGTPDSKKRRASASAATSHPLQLLSSGGTGVESGMRSANHSHELQAAPRLTALQSMAVDDNRMLPSSSPSAMGSHRHATDSGRGGKGTSVTHTFSMDYTPDQGHTPASKMLKSGSRSARVGRMHSLTSMRDLTASRGGMNPLSGRSTTGAQEELDDVKRNAETMLMMAASMQMVVKKVKNPATGEPLTMRVGLHTGNIIAGVIGTRTLRYDMWGADVLAANLMESNARHGGILVSEVTRDALTHLQPYGISFEDAGVVDVNDMGALSTFHVNGDLTAILRRGPPAAAAGKGRKGQ